jgi:diguanylate cyclase (GGDEF)-like protein
MRSLRVPVDSRVRAWALGWLFIAGASIGLVSLLLPHPPGANELALYSNVAFAYVGGVLLLWLGPRAPSWFFHVAMAIGAVIITRAIFYSGEAVSFYAVWYLWVGLYAFYFFDRLAAAAHVSFVAALYALTLVHFPATSSVARWLTTVATLVVAGWFIDTLVRRVRRQADEAEHSAHSMATVAEVARELAGLSDVSTARQLLCATCARVSGATSVVLWQPSPDGAGLVAEGFAGPAPPVDVLTFVGPQAGGSQAYATGSPTLVDGEEAVSRLAPELRGAVWSARCGLWQPIHRDATVVAVLGFYWEADDALARPSLRAQIDLLAAETAATLQRVELLERLAHIARTDDLTGLPNRRAWDEELTREISRAAREQRPLCVAILDLDHFKLYNDQHGHQAGDRLLKQAAAAWSRELRATDLLARYGGEEFTLALSNMHPDEAAHLLERLRRATPEGQTCSAGVACWDGEESGPKLLGRADSALYRAKRAGRDRAAPAEV